MKKLVSGIAVAALGMALGARSVPGQAQSSATQSAASTVMVEENVLYATVNGSELHLDVYEPSEKSSGTRPAVILIHGGGWSDPDKSTMRGMGNFLACNGLVAFSVDYRLFQGRRIAGRHNSMMCSGRCVGFGQMRTNTV